MATLVDFTTPFPGGPTFYTGTSAPSGLVPDIFPVAIGGRAYMLDMASGRYARAFEARLRDSVDQSNIPGENTINPQGLWRRSQTSWNFGMAQSYGDIADSQDNRFFDSLGVDVWTEGQLTLLNDTNRSLTSANSNLFLAVVGDELWVADDDEIKYTSDPFASSPSWSTISGTGVIRSMVTLGADAYVVFAGTGGTQGVVKVSGSSHTLASPEAEGVEFGKIGYAKGRLVVGANASSKLWFDPSSNNPPADFEHPDAEFRWVGFAGGQNAIYCAGYSGQRSLIYKVTIQADGTLDEPVVAAELPVGETIQSLAGYLGYVLIGTDKGLRVATSDADANLVLGPTFESPNPILCADGFEEYVWVGVTNYTATKTGLGRVDLSRLVGPNEPARAPDLMYTGQGNVVSVVTFGGKRVFTVAGAGVIVEDDSQLVESGYIDVGTWRWGIPDSKVLAFVDVETERLNGSVQVEYAFDGNGFDVLGAESTSGVTSRSFTGPDTLFREVKFKFTLGRDSSTVTLGPVVRSWQARVVPCPTRSELFQVPLLLHSRVNRFNRDYSVDVNEELEFLRDLVDSPRVVNFQEGSRTYKVIVENVEWVPVDTAGQGYEFDGTCTVTMRSLVA